MRILGIVVGLLITASACGKEIDDEPSGPVELQIRRADWTGWSREQPKPTTRTVTVEEGGSFEVDVSAGDPITFEVVDIDDGDLSIKASDELSLEGEDGGISLLDTTREFTIRDEEPFEVNTPTMDAGTEITFTVLGRGD